ncbi:histidinol-phosphatase (PHP family) [Motilibacter peucedani]|uniref:Histidinol-phosphatase n=1 Tax=Motilibacter peucedani TaxID=598650 RepID=A0A420XT48_9ACTN|nr:PHP domain-containing protein [Motilibacter peucedani]RKS80003.1 histidinol-phosphatase (PHP family) [Motilibacter peucedani]
MRPLPSDNHVHSQFSYDRKPESSMLAACARAVELGVPSVAFTEHLDFSVWQAGDAVAARVSAVEPDPRIQPLDLEHYLASVAECRDRFPDLRVLTGVESGEAHLFGASLDQVLRTGRFDRVLGSCHAVVHEGVLVEVDTLVDVLPTPELMHRYLAEVLRLVEGSYAFEVLAHVDFARRYVRPGTFDEAAHEEDYRAVFRALARSDRALEVNTKSPLASVDQVRWFREEGGRAVSFGSDAHVPWMVGSDFELAVDVVEAAGFRPGRDPYDFWRA